MILRQLSPKERAAFGPPFLHLHPAVCADYRRKMPWASPEVVLARQRQDSVQLIERRSEWAGQASVASYRCEVHAGGRITFRALDADGTDQATAEEYHLRVR